MEINEFGYYAKMVADQLGIESSTLRKWSLELEQCGYVFERNVNKHRSYYEKDIRALTEMKKQLGLQHSLRDVAKYIVKELEKGRFDEDLRRDNAQITPSVICVNNAAFMQGSRLDEFQSAIITGVVEGLKTQFAPTGQEGMWQQVLDALSEVQKSTSKALELPIMGNPSESKLDTLEVNFARLVNAHTRLVQDFEGVRQRNIQLEQLNEQLRQQLAEKPKKKGWFGR